MKCVVARSALYTGQATHPPSVYSADTGPEPVTGQTEKLSIKCVLSTRGTDRGGDGGEEALSRSRGSLHRPPTPRGEYLSQQDEVSCDLTVLIPMPM